MVAIGRSAEEIDIPNLPTRSAGFLSDLPSPSHQQHTLKPMGRLEGKIAVITGAAGYAFSSYCQ